MHPLDCWLFLFFCRAAVHLICVYDGHWIWSSVPKLLPFNFIVIFGEWRKLQEANLMRGPYGEWKLLCCLAKKTQSALSWHSGMQHGQKMTGSDLKIPAVLEAQSCLLIHEMARFKWAKFAVFMDLFSELLFFSHTSLVHIWLLVHGQICMSSNIKHPHFSHVLPITISCCVV